MKIIIVRKKLLILLVIIIFIGLIFLNYYDVVLKLMYPLKYEEQILAGSKKYSLDPYLISSVIYVESKFVEGAHSRRGAIGLMQIMPETAKWIAESKSEVFQEGRLYRAEVNIDYGCWYLASLRSEFDGNLIYMLTAYNAGRGTLKRWIVEDRLGENNILGDIPYQETRNYVRQVFKAYEIYRDLYHMEDTV